MYDDSGGDYYCGGDDSNSRTGGAESGRRTEGGEHKPGRLVPRMTSGGMSSVYSDNG